MTDGTLVHRRTIEIDAVELDDGRIELTGRLRDERPYPEARRAAVLHDMTLRVMLDRGTATIAEAEAAMASHPHAECPQIAPALSGLEGLSVARGYNRAVRERVGGVAGCAHLLQLALAMGPAALQAFNSSRRRKAARAEQAPDPSLFMEAMADTCHVWARDTGPGTVKVAIGWRPNDDEYPAPPLDVIRQRQSNVR